MTSLLPAVPPVVPLHLGSLHPYEQALTLALAFGPFVVLGVVIAVRRRQDRAAELETGFETGSDAAVDQQDQSGQRDR